MYKRLLVAVDGSPVSDQALNRAIELAREAQGQVLLAHVVDDMPYVSSFDLASASAPDLMQVLRENGQRVLDEARARVVAAGVACDTRLFERFGERLGDTIAGAAHEWQADLIVLGTHGRKGVGRLVLGSGAEQIIRSAPVAVLVERHAEA